MQQSHIENYRISAFKYFLLLILLGGIFFTYINVVEKVYGLALLDAVFSVMSFLVLMYVYKSKALTYLPIIMKVMLALFYVAILLALWLVPSISITLVAWVFLVPPLSYLLLGRFLGGLYTSIYVALLLLIFVTKFLGDSWLDNIFLIGNLISCLLVVWGLTNLYETSQEEFYKEQQDLVAKDPVTGLLNRTRLKQEYGHYLAESVKKKSALSLALISVDWFDMLIERYGYEEGNRFLAKLANSIKPLKREQDIIFHFGSGEFCILLPFTESKEALDAIEKCRVVVMNDFANYENKNLSITLSVGIAQCTREDLSFTDLLKKADERLYKAKELGSNQVIADL